MHNKPDIIFPDEKTTGNPDFTKGCYICGWHAPSLKNNGLERAHIFADGKVSNLPWNILPLCPVCHQGFDSIIKPFIANALLYATGGFLPNPYNPKEIKKFSPEELAQFLKITNPNESEQA